MTYEEASKETERLREAYDRSYTDGEKRRIALLYREVTGKDFQQTTCQQCYHDAVIEVYLYLKNNKTMAKKCNYRLRAGFIISCPDFQSGKIYTNDNLTDAVAKAYLDKYPKQEKMFQKLPEAAVDDENAGEKDGEKDGEKN